MKRYSILIVGLNCYSGHIREFVVNLKKKNPRVEISLLTTSVQDKFKDEIYEFTEQIMMVKRYKGRVKLPFFATLMNIMYLYWALFRLFCSGRYDIVDIHFAKPFIKYALPVLRRITNNVIFTPWGSDVLRVEDEKSLKNMQKIYSYAKYVTTGKDTVVGKCVVSKLNVSPDKMVKLGWGGEFFDYAQENLSKITTEDAKARFGLNGKYVITCGYNMQQAQRHEEIIDAVCEVKNQLPSNLTLLFLFTYARNDKQIKYKEMLVERCKSQGLDFVVIEDFLDLNDLLKLRVATDIFVHVQTSDAGSRCVAEYILCNKKVVHGAWMKYAYLENHQPSCMFLVESRDQLGKAIVNACRTKIGNLQNDVRAAIMERSWNSKMTLWNNFFESLVS